MGGIETVTSADAYAVFDNPSAGLFGRQKAQAATSFFTLADKTTYSAAGYYKFNMQHLLAAAGGRSASPTGTRTSRCRWPMPTGSTAP